MPEEITPAFVCAEAVRNKIRMNYSDDRTPLAAILLISESGTKSLPLYCLYSGADITALIKKDLETRFKFP